MVIDESPTYLRLSDGAVIGSGKPADTTSSVDAMGRGSVRNALIAGVPLVTDPLGGDDRDRYRGHDRARRFGAGRGDHDDRIDDTPVDQRRSADSRDTMRPMTTTISRSPRRRTVVALSIVLIVLVAFVVRLVDIQVVNARTHVSDSLAMGLENSRIEYASRGSIVDENGVVLASAVNRYDVQVDPMLAAKGITTVDAGGDDDSGTTTAWPELAAQIAAVTGQDAAEVEKVVTDAVADNPDSRYAMIAKNVSTEQYRALAELKLPFLSFPPQSGGSTPTARSAATCSDSSAATVSPSPVSRTPTTTASPPPTARSSSSRAVTASCCPAPRWSPSLPWTAGR